MTKNQLSIRLSVTIFLVSIGFYLVSGNQEDCMCELVNNSNCTKFRCPIDKCGNFSSLNNFTCLCEKNMGGKNGCQALNINAVVQKHEVMSCNEHFPFICSDNNNNFQIYAEENKTWIEAVKACEERNLHIAQENLSTINYNSNSWFWIGKFFGTATTSDIDDVSQYQMTVHISEMNSTSVINATCKIQSEMFRLTTTSASPTSPTANFTTESMSPTPASNDTVTEVHTTDTTHIITTNYESTEGPSSTEKETSSSTPEISASQAVTTLTSVNGITFPSPESRTTTSAGGKDVKTTDTSNKSNTETTTSSVGIVTNSSTSDIRTSPSVTTTYADSITSLSPESHPSTSSLVDITTTNHGNITETPSTITQTGPSATTQSADYSPLSTTTNNSQSVKNGSTRNVITSTLSVTNANILSTVSNTAVKPKPGSSEEARQDDQDNTPALAGAISGGAVLIIIGATVLYIKYRRNQNQVKKNITKASGIAGYTDQSLRGKPNDKTQTQNPIYLPLDESPHVHGHHGQDAAAESDDENNYNHFDKKRMQNGFESENDTYDHARLDTQADSTYGYGILQQNKDVMVDDVYDHTGALTEGTYGHLHQKDETSRPDSDTYGTSSL